MQAKSNQARTERLPLPPTPTLLGETLLQLVRLPKLFSLTLTPRGIEVARGAEADEQVVPQTIREIASGTPSLVPDFAFVLQSVGLDPLPPDPERHQLTTFIQMTDLITQADLRLAGWFVTRGDALDAFLAQPKGTLPKTLFGVPVYYVREEDLPDGRLVLIGSPTGALADASAGVVADIGG